MVGVEERAVAIDPRHISIAGMVYPADREPLFQNVAEQMQKAGLVIEVSRHPKQVDEDGKPLDSNKRVRLRIGREDRDPNLDPFWRAVMQKLNRRESPNQNGSTHE